MTTRMVAATWLSVGVLGLGVAAAPQYRPIERFAAETAVMTGPARLSLRPVDIAISRWSTFTDHRELATALLEKGPVAFLNLLCGYGAVGSIGTIGAPDVAIRYAWSIDEEHGSRRIYLATDEPASLTLSLFQRFLHDEPLTFIELRVNRYGDGEGKLSEAARLTVDESRNVIELRDYDRRPVQLIRVRSLNNNDE